MGFLAGVASVALGSLGSIAGGNAQSSQMKAQAQLEDQNAQVARQNLIASNQQASAREEALRRSTRQALGRQRAAIAQSGTEFSGSNLDIIGQSTANAELDALNLRYAGQIEAAGLRNEISSRTASAASLRKAARSARSMGFLNAGMSAASGLYGLSNKASSSSGAYGQGSIGSFGNNLTGFKAGVGI